MQDVLAWAVREGVTNVLRHSDARTCSITARRRGGTVRLEIVNDGVREPKGEVEALIDRAAEEAERLVERIASEA